MLVPSPHVSLFMNRKFNDQFGVVFLIVMSFEQTINMMMWWCHVKLKYVCKCILGRGEGGVTRGGARLGKGSPLFLAQNLSGLEFNDHFLHSGLPLQVISLNTHQHSTAQERQRKMMKSRSFTCV